MEWIISGRLDQGKHYVCDQKQIVGSNIRFHAFEIKSRRCRIDHADKWMRARKADLDEKVRIVCDRLHNNAIVDSSNREPIDFYLSIPGTTTLRFNYTVLTIRRIVSRDWYVYDGDNYWVHDVWRAVSMYSKRDWCLLPNLQRNAIIDSRLGSNSYLFEV